MDSKIMWIERKDGPFGAEARIGRVTYSKTGRTIYYQGKELRSLAGAGFKSNYYDVATGEEYWISGCKKGGKDALYSVMVEIDEDVREEYWTAIRNMPKSRDVPSFKSIGKYQK